MNNNKQTSYGMFFISVLVHYNIVSLRDKSNLPHIIGKHYLQTPKYH